MQQCGYCENVTKAEARHPGILAGHREKWALPHREQTPFAGDALEAVRAPIGKSDTGARDQIPHRAGHDNLIRFRERCHARADVYGEPDHIVVLELALAGVQSGAHLKTEAVNAIANRTSASNRARRPIEGRQQSVAGGIRLASTKSRQFLAHDPKPLLSQRTPARVADFGNELSRSDDVGEHHGGQYL
jgi:hypothetical protein